MTLNSSSKSIPATLTAADVEALARRVHALRADWHFTSLLTKLTDLARTYDGALLRRAALEGAKNRDAKTPAGIEWALDDLANPTARAWTEPCAVCGKPRDKCDWDRPLVRNGADYDDHVYTTKADALAAAARKAGRRGYVG